MKDSTIILGAVAALGLIGSTEAGKGGKGGGKNKCSTPAQYEIEIYDTLTSVSAPSDFNDAHFSPTLAAVHDSNFALWGPGFAATTGVKSVAETGSLTDIEAEIAAYDQFVYMTDKLSAGFFLTDQAVAEKVTGSLFVDVTESFPYVSTIHMIAGSPDWFTGVRNIDLCDDKGYWMKDYETSSQPYDAGTDCGTTYASADCVETTPLRVFKITPALTTDGTDGGRIFVGTDGAVAPVATWKFKLVQEEDEEDSEDEEEDSEDEEPKSKPKAKAMPSLRKAKARM